MRLCSIFLFVISALPCANAQRDAPVWNSYLPRITMFNERTTLDFELTFQKGGGPNEQSANCQMYVLGYLEKDESRILKLALDESHTNKSNPRDQSLIDVLQKEQLAVILETKAAKQAEIPMVVSPKTRRAVRGGSCYDFEFSFDNKALFDRIGNLKNFDRSNFVDYDNRYYNDKFKLLIFVPVNDSAYATLIPKEQQESYDFAHFMDSKTMVQYLKPLPYRFQMKPLDDEDVVLLYID